MFEINDIVMKEKIFSVRDHYDFEDVRRQLGLAEGNLLQFPPKIVVADNHDEELIHLQWKMVSLRSEYDI